MADGVGAPVGDTTISTLTGTITSTAIPPSPIEQRATHGGTTPRIVGALRTQTARQPTGLAQTPAAIRWPAGKKALSNKSPGKKAIWEVRALAAAAAVDLPIAQVAAILGARVPARERVLARVRAPVAPTASATAVRAAVFQEVTVVDSGQAVSVAALLARAGAGALRASAGGVAEVAVVVVVVVVAAEAEGGKL